MNLCFFSEIPLFCPTDLTEAQQADITEAFFPTQWTCNIQKCVCIHSSDVFDQQQYSVEKYNKINQKQQLPEVIINTVYSSQEIFCIEFILVFMRILRELQLTTSNVSRGTVDACYQGEILC